MIRSRACKHPIMWLVERPSKEAVGRRGRCQPYKYIRESAFISLRLYSRQSCWKVLWIRIWNNCRGSRVRSWACESWLYLLWWRKVFWRESCITFPLCSFQVSSSACRWLCDGIDIFSLLSRCPCWPCHDAGHHNSAHFWMLPCCGLGCI